MELIDDPRWTKLVKAEQARRELEGRESVSPAKWNRVQDRWNEAADAVLHEAVLLRKAKERALTTTDVAELHFLKELLDMPVLEYWPDVQALRRDPRVDADKSQIEITPALYVAETVWGPVDHPYQSDIPEKGMNRYLTRIGGAPTMVPGVKVPMDPFLLQIDFPALRIYGNEDTAKFRRASKLPAKGLLQLFHTTEGDSRTDSELPGGGVTLLYLDEEQLKLRGAPDTDHESAVFAASVAGTAWIPSFRHTRTSTEESMQKVIELQRAADRWARQGDWSGHGDKPDPFTVVPDPVSRVLGLQHYDYELEDEDLALLQERLPLQDGKDAHRLLLNVASERAFEGLYGDAGRLEVWIRASDLSKTCFDTIVSFWRST